MIVQNMKATQEYEKRMFQKFVNPRGRGCDEHLGCVIQDAGCLVVDEEDQVEPQMFGQVASFYYLKHQTMAVFAKNLTAGLGVPKVTLATPRAMSIALALMKVCCTSGQSLAFCTGHPQVCLADTTRL